LPAVNTSLAPRAESSLSPPFVSACVVAGLTLAGLAVRAAGLDESLFGDELFTVEVSSRSGLDDVVSGVASDLEISPPLYFVFAWATGKVGDPHVWLRMPGLLAGVATIPAVYVLGLRTVGRRAAIVAAALLAFSPFAVFYATEARAYALATLFVVLSTLALLSALDAGGRLRWGLFALAAWAALFTHYTTVFPLAAQAAWAAWAHRDRLRELALAHAVVGVALLPWLPEFLDDRNAGFQTAIETYWPLTVSFFSRSLAGWLAGNPYLGLTTIPGTAALVMLGAGLLLALAGGRAAVAALRRPEAMMVAVIAIATPLAAAAYSLVFASVFVPRSLLAALPALCLALGLFLTAGPRPLAATATILVIAGLVVGAARVVAWNPKPPFRDAAGYIDARTAEGDPVLEVPLDYGTLEAELEAPFRLYRDGCGGPITRPGQILEGDVRCGIPGGFARGVGAARRRIVVLTEPGFPEVRELEQGWRLVGSRTFEHRFRPLEVQEYGRR
jgi:mannosyltransferase